VQQAAAAATLIGASLLRADDANSCMRVARADKLAVAARRHHQHHRQLQDHDTSPHQYADACTVWRVSLPVPAAAAAAAVQC